MLETWKLGNLETCLIVHCFVLAVNLRDKWAIVDSRQVDASDSIGRLCREPPMRHSAKSSDRHLLRT